MKRILLLVFLFLFQYPLFAYDGPPGWSGPTTVTLGSTHTYTFDNWTSPPGLMWYVYKGLIVSYSQTGTAYSVTVQWVETGSGYLYLAYDGDIIPAGFSTRNVTIGGTPPPTPNPTFTVLSQTCNRTVVKRNAGPPSGITWYWQSLPTGTNYFLGSADTVVLTTAGSNTIYLRAQMNGAPIWSGAQTVGTFTVVTPLQAPATATDGHRIGNTLTAIPLSVATVSGATSYRWFTESSGGVPISGATTNSYTPSVTQTKTYYAEAWVQGCGGSARKPVVAYLHPKAVVTSDDGTINMGSTAVLKVTNHTYDSYQWINAQTGTPVAGATEPMFSTLTAGNFRVRVTKGGSPPDTSSIFVVGKGMESLNMNYVISNDVLVPGITYDGDVANLMVEQKSQTIQYFDGLGAPMQTVITQGSPSKKDIVQQTVYDGFGREHRKYLPVVVNKNSGWYKSGILNARGAYSSIAEDFYQDNPTARIAQDTMPFTQTVFEASPASRPVADYGAGAEWAVNKKRIRYDYRVNAHTTTPNDTAERVIAWRINSSNRPARKPAVSGYVTADGCYTTGQLAIKIVKDEQGNAVREYTNKEGQVILKKVQALVADSANLNSADGWALTYYVYDNLGNLRFVLPPELSKIAHSADTAMTTTRLDNWAFQYTYDARKRMITKQVPGAGAVYMVYDNRDRLVATQDANQRSTSNKYWSFTKYDQLNRPILTGIKDTTAALTQAQMQAAVDAHYAKAWARLFETYVGTATGNMHGYSNKSYPVLTGPTTSNDKDRYLSATYYDMYGYKTTLTDSSRYTFSANHLAGQDNSYFTRLTGQVTGTKIKVLDGGVTGNYTWLTTVNYYDDDYRVIQTVSDNYKGGTDRITNRYDFTGKVLKTAATHTTYDVTWKDKIAVAFQGNRIYRTAAGTGWGGGGAASAEQLAANQNGWIEMNVTDNSTDRMFGFSTSNPDAGIASMKYAVYVNGSVLRVYKDGALAPSGNLAGQTVRGERLRWERTGTTLYLKRNGATVYTFTGVTTAAMMADVTFFSQNSSLANVSASFAGTSHTVTRSFTYDHAGRVLEVWHKLDNEDSVLLVKNVYNELGQLVDKKLHSTDGETFKQSVDYAYNIRGWLTKVNESDLSTADADAGRDLFGMRLGYNDDLGISNTPLYNGNISGIVWSNNLALGDIKQNAYTYSYDPMNRIKTSAYKEKGASSWTTAANYGNNETGFTYDLNGNIKTLQRNDRRTTGWMDNLTYDYGTGTAQSNKLLNVTDAGDKTKGFIDIVTSSGDYTYDANGNLLWDRNKGGAELLTNGSFDNGSTGWTVTNGGRLTFTNSEIQIVTGAAVSTLKQSVISTTKPYVLTLDLVLTGGKITLTTGGVNTEFTGTGLHTVAVTAGTTNSDFTVTASANCSGTIKSVSVKGIAVITYNFLNLPEIVTRPGDKQLQYIYDASGRKLRQEVSKNGVMEKTTDYAGEYIYENDTLRFINHEEGRIIPVSLSPVEGWEYQYHLKDHLGNVRMTFTSKHVVDTAVATMETANASEEQAEFLYYNEAVKINATIFDHTDTGSTHYALRLTGKPGYENGLAKSLSVMPGDTIRASVFAKYLERDTTQWNNGSGFATFMNTIRWGTPGAGVLVDGGLAGSTGGVTPPYGSLTTKGSGTQTGAPKAYLNILVFDHRDSLVDFSFTPVTEAAREYGQNGAHQELFKEHVIKQAGLVYIYLSNDNILLNGSMAEVYFDDFTVEHVKSPVIQQDDYYAFGLEFNSYQRENSTKNNYLYNGKEKQDELGLGWLDYGARMYMPDVGRWGVIDNKADKYAGFSPYNYAMNSPIFFIDPDGNEIIPNIKITRTEVRNKGITYTAEGSITLKVKIINKSNVTVDLDALKKSLAEDVKNTYSGQGFYQETSRIDLEGNLLNSDHTISVFSNITVNVEFETIQSLDELKEDDHVLMLVNDVVKKEDDDVNPQGRADLSGNVAVAEAGAKDISGVANHEFGHNFGLPDLYRTASGKVIELAPGNTMSNSTNRYTHVRQKGKLTFDILWKQALEKHNGKKDKKDTKKRAKEFAEQYTE